MGRKIYGSNENVRRALALSLLFTGISALTEIYFALGFGFRVNSATPSKLVIIVFFTVYLLMIQLNALQLLRLYILDLLTVITVARDEYYSWISVEITVPFPADFFIFYFQDDCLIDAGFFIINIGDFECSVIQVSSPRFLARICHLIVCLTMTHSPWDI